MDMNVLFVVSVAFISVKGQFLNTEYRLDSAPLPLRQRVNKPPYEIQPSIGHEIEFSPETDRISNQGRRHIIENNRRGNIQSALPSVNVQTFELKPNANAYQNNDGNREIILQNLRQNDNKQQVYVGNQNKAGLQEPNSKDFVRNLNINTGNLDLNQKPIGKNKLRTNLDSTTKLPPRRDLYNPENDNVRTYEILPNSQQNTANNKDVIRSNEQQSKFNLDRTSQSQGDQLNGAADDNIRTKTNTRHNENNNKQTANRHIEANKRAIDNNGLGNQHVNTANKNYESKPNRQNTATGKDKDSRNRETNGFSTETTRYNTIHDRTVTGGTKSTEENEVTSKSSSERRPEDNEDERWIWMSSSNPTASKKTTTASSIIPTVDDRAAFDGDKCPMGKVRYNNICVDKD